VKLVGYLWLWSSPSTYPLFLSFDLQPWPTLDQVAKDKNVGSLPLLPYSSMIANCLLWGTYGALKKEPKIWATNSIGLIFGLFYFLQFIKFAPRRSPSFPGSIWQHISACLAVFVTAVTATTLLPVGDAANILGNMAVLFCIAMFGSPLSSLKTVIQTKSASSIPLPFTIATCLNCVFWSVVGIFQMKDAKVYIPNVLGLSFGLAQVALKLIFGNGRSQLENKEALM
jgi:solute carrier family 50 (sugar transporter)